MKKISKIIIFLFISILSFSSCDDMLDVDSERLLFASDNKLEASNDTLYSMVGIFSQLQKLADSYVLLGELRADLMDVNESADIYLKEINNFDFSSNNPYTGNLKDYYAVINNCNFVINTIDTSKVKANIQIMKKVFAASKAIRAWTYMQIMLNYGNVIYYDEPILTVNDAQKSYITYNSIYELAPVLIADISPWKDIEKPSLGSFSVLSSKDSYFPIRFLLGDLYLWTGQYENAAREYHDLMYKSKYIVSTSYRSTLEVINGAFTGNYSYNPSWGRLFNSGSSEYITSIVSSNQYGQYFELDSLNLNLKIKPSEIAIKKWDSQMYFHNDTTDTIGDQRKLYSVGYVEKSSVSSTGFYLWLGNSSKKVNSIYKYTLQNPLNLTIKQVMPYRVALLYLRYAEAVNRLGKPNLAFAVLKNGLNSATLATRRFVPLKEMPDSILPDYMDFRDVRFTTNIGIRMRGCGNVNQDTSHYIIPYLTAIEDSILFVEDKIQEELALERAFEGNRFQDLMRFAIRRNDNSYLANKVAEKHIGNKEAIKTKLMDRNNWYLKQ